MPADQNPQEPASAPSEGAPRQKSAVRRAAGGWWSIVTMPYRRAAGDLKSSYDGIRNTMGEVSKRREEQRHHATAIGNYLQDLTPAEKFSQYYEVNGWTEPELQRQKVALRRTRRGLLTVGVAGFAGLITALIFLPYWLIVIFGPLAISFLAACWALAVRYAWWEFELQGRALLPFQQFLSRPDLFRRLFA